MRGQNACRRGGCTVIICPNRNIVPLRIIIYCKKKLIFLCFSSFVVFFQQCFSFLGHISARGNHLVHQSERNNYVRLPRTYVELCRRIYDDRMGSRRTGGDAGGQDMTHEVRVGHRRTGQDPEGQEGTKKVRRVQSRTVRVQVDGRTQAHRYELRGDIQSRDTGDRVITV